MKKAFLPLAIAAAMSLGASAQLIPNSFNYQAVTNEHSAEINVEFSIVNAQGTELYVETQVLTTEANGAFSTTIGTGEDWNTLWLFNAANEEGLTLVTKINDVEVSKAPLQAVPYANIAASYVGQDEMESDLANAIAENKEQQTKINEIDTNVWGALELANIAGTIAESAATEVFEMKGVLYGEEDGPIKNLNQQALWLGNLVADQDEAIANLQEAVDYATSDIQGIQESLRGKASVESVSELEAALAGYRNDTQETLMTSFAEAYDLIMANADAIEIVSSDVQGIQEKLRGYATVEEVAAIADGLDITQEDVMNLTEGNKENKAAIADIQATLARVGENLDYLPAMFENYDEQIANLEQAIEYATSDVQGIQEKLRGYATVEEVAAIADGLDITQEDVINLTEGNKENKAAIAEIKNTMWTYSDMENYTENLQMSFVDKETYYADKAELDEAIFNATSDIQGIQETLRGKANVSEVNDANEQIKLIWAALKNLADLVGHSEIYK